VPPRRRTETRSKRKARSLHAAIGVSIPQHADVCVIGGGAAGIVAAIAAAEHGAQVVVLERDAECGKTILATGNGRCNFANRHLDPQLYNDPAFVCAVCGKQWLDDVLDFFEASGLFWAEESEGRLYPLSRQAASVRTVLLARANRAGVLFGPAREVTQMTHTKRDASVTYRETWPQGGLGALSASALVIAVGGGETFLQNASLSYTKPTPLLCPIACVHPIFEALDGRRVRARVSLLRDGAHRATEQGEVLFRTYGLSGIAVFNLSRHAAPEDTICMDLLPTLSLECAQAYGTIALEGILDPVIADALRSFTSSNEEAISLAKSLSCRIVGLTETNHAQVHRGGLATAQFDPRTLRLQSTEPLYACGEGLDVDGPCGGYNLAWAWKSGMVAGASAAKEVLR